MRRREFVKTGLALSALTGCAGKKQVPSRGSGMGSIVYEPIRIKKITVPNRIVFPAITTRYADDEGFVTQKLIDFHRNIAEGSAGLSIVGATAVRKDGILLPKMYRLDNDTYIDGMKKLVKSIKKSGSIACVQLFHGGRKTFSAVTGVQPVAPSPLPHPNLKDVPRELSVNEIKEFVKLFADATYRAKTAGADIIELHGAHGYLICQFLSPFSNKRNDEYGGSTENRTRFLREILFEVRQKVGDDYPLCCRISADEYVEGGLELEETKYIAQILVDSGIDIISVSAGIDGNGWAPDKNDGNRCFAHLARGIKESVNIPVIGVGNILDITDAEVLIEYGDADFAAMGRALIADPYVIEKSSSGKTDKINRCIQCRNCLSSLVKSHMSCTVNKDLT